MSDSLRTQILDMMSLVQCGDIAINPILPETVGTVVRHTLETGRTAYVLYVSDKVAFNLIYDDLINDKSEYGAVSLKVGNNHLFFMSLDKDTPDEDFFEILRSNEEASHASGGDSAGVHHE